MGLGGSFQSSLCTDFVPYLTLPHSLTDLTEMGHLPEPAEQKWAALRSAVETDLHSVLFGPRQPQSFGGSCAAPGEGASSALKQLGAGKTQEKPGGKWRKVAEEKVKQKGEETLVSFFLKKRKESQRGDPPLSLKRSSELKRSLVCEGLAGYVGNLLTSCFCSHLTCLNAHRIKEGMGWNQPGLGKHRGGELSGLFNYFAYLTIVCFFRPKVLPLV